MYSAFMQGSVTAVVLVLSPSIDMPSVPVVTKIIHESCSITATEVITSTVNLDCPEPTGIVGNCKSALFGTHCIYRYVVDPSVTQEHSPCLLNS